MVRLRDTIIVLFITIFSSPVLGDGLSLRSLEGGATRALEIDGQYWYQGVGDHLLVLDKRSGRTISRLQLAEPPASALCSDLIIHNGRLWGLLDGQEVVEVDLTEQASPTMIKRINADQLGIIPRGFAIIHGDLVVLGEGGVVQILDGNQIVSCKGNVTGVVHSIDRGIVYAADRRLFDASSGEFLGSATLLAPLDKEANVEDGTFVFTRDLGNRTEVGLMTPEGRDVDAFDGTIMLDGGNATLNTVRSRVHVCTDEGVYILGVAPKEIRLLKTISINGANDVGVIASNYLAICGDHGREIFRIALDRVGEGNTHLRKVPATSSMQRGHAHRFHVDIPTTTGVMRYEYSGRIYPSEELEISVDPNPQKIVVLGWSATRDAETGNVFILDSKGVVVEGLDIQRANTMVAIGGNFWFGTDTHIIVCGPDVTGNMLTLGSLQIAGPLVQIIGQLDGNAVFVSATGIVGVITPTYDVALEQ